jgi:hypothetical protein
MEADCSLFILGMIWLGFSCIVRFDWDNFLMKLRLRFWVKKRSWWCVGWWIWRLFYRVTEREQWMHATKRWEGLSCGGDEGSGAIWRKRTIVRFVVVWEAIVSFVLWRECDFWWFTQSDTGFGVAGLTKIQREKGKEKAYSCGGRGEEKAYFFFFFFYLCVNLFFFSLFFFFKKKILLSSFSHKNFSRISQSSLHFSAHMIFLLDFFVSRFSSVLFREFFLHCLFLIYSPFTIYIF